MFDNAPSVFDNVPADHRPDVASTAPPVHAHAADGMSGSPDGLGASPDGLGAFPRRPVTGMGGFARPVQGMGAFAHPVEQMGGQAAWLEPQDASPQAALRTAGITALAAAIFFGGGLAMGGPWGGVSGILLSGSGFNVYRAQKWWGSADASEKYEAVVSAFFGAVGLAAGGYAAYKAYDSKQ